MTRRWWRAVVAGLALGVTGAPAPVSSQDNAELARARQVLEYYQACERTRHFAPCWTLLSQRVQGDWSKQGRGTVAEYALAKGSGATRYSDFRVLQIRRSPSRVVFVVEATGGGDESPLRARVEYALLREGGQWRIDGLRIGQSEMAP
jgi:hypothetical protein